MKWSRAVHHLEELAHTCADMAQLPTTISLESATDAYEQRRFGPGKIGPVADTCGAPARDTSTS